MADGILLEAAGLPAAVICTDAFRGSGDAMAHIQGFAGYRYLVTRHPVSSLGRGQLRERARELLPGVLGLLEQAGAAGAGGAAGAATAGGAESK